ncbi:MAG: hypothetical protein ABS95_00800 [Verrucomicrobia bacterium SCN 57-15]|nr:MAG: hypothetical protein ABS95_00800 [Verrucomicrobia bacterium SCN 57-15]
MAAGCVVLWLLATSYCSVEHLFGLDHHHEDSDGHVSGDLHQTVADNDAAEHSHHEGDADVAHHSHDAEGNNHGSHHHDGKEDFCCSTIQATVLSSNPVPLGKPVLTQIAFLCVLVQVSDLVSLPSNDSSPRHAKSRDWVLTPEVCTGPANRSHAPPASV